MSWQCNGYVLDGERLTQVQLAGKMGVTENQLSKLIAQVQKDFTKQFEDRESVRRQIFSVASKLLYQIQDDRARAVIYADQLDSQISRITKEFDYAFALSEGSYTEFNRKRKKVTSLMSYLRNLYSQKSESLKILSSTSHALSDFLSLFTHGSEKRLPVPNIHVDIHPNANGEQPIHFTEAIRLIESKIPSNLPKQDVAVMGHGDRNPNQGFEEFEATEDAK